MGIRGRKRTGASIYFRSSGVKMERFTITLPQEFGTRFREICSQLGVPMSTVFNILAKDWVEKAEQVIEERKLKEKKELTAANDALRKAAAAELTPE